MDSLIKWTWLAALGLGAAGCSADGDNGDSGTPTAPNETDPAAQLQVVDEFTQTSYNSVNILWVIDPAWQSEISNHVAQLETFYELLLLHGIPWKVAVMTPQTDVELTRGELYGIHQHVTDLQNMGSNYQVFGDTPTNFRGAVHWHLTERTEDYPDFYFAGGHLSIVAFADSRDETPPGFISRQDFVQFLDDQDSTISASISAITVGIPEVRDSWVEYANATGGIVTSSPNAELNLERIALASLGLEKSWTLSEVPSVAPPTILQTYRANQRRLTLGEDYTFDYATNTITLTGEAPLAGTKLTVTYQRRIEGPAGGRGGDDDPTDSPTPTP